ncbi:MAG: hypothetical protein AAFY59_18095, partial [Pseudomonadota bacterium]
MRRRWLDRRSSLYVMLTVFGCYLLAETLAPTSRMAVRGCFLEYVYDGDTVALECPDGRRTARLVGFDTPEVKSPGCRMEAALGARATE